MATLLESLPPARPAELHATSIAKTISVPADATLVISDTPIYLMEGDLLKGGASAASDLDLFISYEVLDDA